MKYLSIPVVLCLIITFFSQYSLAESAISKDQQSILDTLPADQRESVLDKMNQSSELNEELQDTFENFQTLQERPDRTILSPEEQEEFLKQSASWVFGYELFQTSPTTFAPATTIPIPPSYTLGAGDKIQINYYGNDEKVLVAYISRSGRITLPLLGPVTLAGLTFEEAESLIRKKVSTELLGTDVIISLSELRSISVYLLGEAYMPGSYTISSLSTLTNLLFVSGGVSEKGSVRNIEVKRSGKTVHTFDLYDLILKGDTSTDFRLQDGDAIFIPLIKRTAKAEGSFRRPFLFELSDSDTVKDLIFYAGGLKTSISDKTYLSINKVNTETASRTITLINPESNDDLEKALFDGDIVNAREVAGFKSGSIELKGELAFPGVYSFTQGETLLDLMKRAGGLTEFAYTSGAVFAREDVAEKQKLNFEQTADMIESAIADSILSGQLDVPGESLNYISYLIRSLRKERPIGRIVVEIDPLAMSKDKHKDFNLNDGDFLFIPKRPSSINVIGEVYSPSSHTYNGKYSYKDYIEYSGGARDSADLSNAYIILPNGQTKKISRRPFSSTRDLLLPGSTLVIPRSARPFDWLVLTREISPILASLTTSAAAIAALSNNR